MKNRTIFTGDNLPVLRGLDSDSVDLIYLAIALTLQAQFATMSLVGSRRIDWHRPAAWKHRRCFMTQDSNRPNRLRFSPRGVTLRERADWILTQTVRTKRGCLIWQGCTNARGYGRTSIDGKQRGTHQIVLRAYKGEPIDPALRARHSCDTPACVNPNHLTWGTQSENNIDDSARGKRRSRLKLTPDQVRDIKRRLAAGESNSALAREYGVQQATICCIKTGRSWTWLA